MKAERVGREGAGETRTSPRNGQQFWDMRLVKGPATSTGDVPPTLPSRLIPAAAIAPPPCAVARPGGPAATRG